jgi:hypothetical protein
MFAKTFAARLGLAVAVVVTALALAAGAQARLPIEPGGSSPVTHKHPRQPAKQRATRVVKRLEGGFPSLSGVHVKSLAEARTE